jgi:predicted membrane chloride channel (bestrophin family)
MRALLQHAAFEFGSGLRNRAMLLLLYLFALGFYLSAGSLMVSLNPGFRDVVIPAMVVFALMAGRLLGLRDPIVTAREVVVGAALAVVLAVRLFAWDRRAEARRVSPVWGALVLVPYVAAAVLLR